MSWWFWVGQVWKTHHLGTVTRENFIWIHSLRDYSTLSSRDTCVYYEWVIYWQGNDNTFWATQGEIGFQKHFCISKANTVPNSFSLARRSQIDSLIKLNTRSLGFRKSPVWHLHLFEFPRRGWVLPQVQVLTLEGVCCLGAWLNVLWAGTQTAAHREGRPLCPLSCGQHHAPPCSLPKPWYLPDVLPNQMTSLKPQKTVYLHFLLLVLVFCYFSEVNQLMKGFGKVQSWCKGSTDEWWGAGMGMGYMRSEQDLPFDSFASVFQIKQAFKNCF